LEGSPEVVGGDFNCSYNGLVSLEGGPRRVGRNFDCSYNRLKTLEGAPEYVGGYFWCDCNELTTLKGIGKVGKRVSCFANRRFEDDMLRAIGRSEDII